MKKTLLITISSFIMATLMTACTGQVADGMVSVGSSDLSSNPCLAIDRKLIRLDEFMLMVNQTSAFHLEEKARALEAPGITVSNNKKQMLRDAKKKHAELLAEHKKLSCKSITTE